MPLAAPTNHFKGLEWVFVGVAVGISIFLLTRNNLPHVGDNIHSLPHGGSYRDGTKSINYCSPARKFPSSNLFGLPAGLTPLALVLGLSAAIYATSCRTSRAVVRCCHLHSAQPI